MELDEAGRMKRDCEPDEIGLIVIKGPHVFSGYVVETQNEGVFLGDGWLNTGDLGRIDADGQLWITGRAKDLIIRGGHNIDPAVIEEVLHQHPAVQLAAAVGKPDGYAGELPVAYVQLKEGATEEPEALLEFARERIPERAATPVEVHLVEKIPLTLVGKIFKPELRWDAARRVLTQQLTPLAEKGLEVAVSVGADPVHGTLVTISLKGEGRRDTLEKEVKTILAPFGLAHKVIWG